MPVATPIEIALDQLSKRVDALSTFGPKAWIPIGISGFALFISIYSAWQNRNQNKETRLHGIKANIDTCKAAIESISMQLAPLRAKVKKTADEERELDIKSQVFEAAIERMLNAYESGCDSFFKGEVNKQHFINMFNTDISQHVSNFQEKFTPPLTSFDNMAKYHAAYIKKPKA
jgi:2-methylisocitrate lyase-like PEP mutase family enzyme